MEDLTPHEQTKATAWDAISEKNATIAALRARVAELEGALDESYSTLAGAFDRVHSLPRTTDTDLANRIAATRAKIAALRAKGGGDE